jgi:hypothetical protein
VSSKKKLKKRIKELEKRVTALEAINIQPFQFPIKEDYPPFSLKEKGLPDEPCMFDGLPDGVYGISCPCKKCTPHYCSTSVENIECFVTEGTVPTVIPENIT